MQQQIVEHDVVFDGVFQIIDLSAVRCNHADGQRALIVFGGVVGRKQLGESLQQQVGFFGVGR